MTLESERMRLYLLGSATVAETEEIEVGLIEDEGMTDRLYVAESELIEDYLEGTLSGAEQAMFENNFLVIEERRDRVNEIRLLKRFSSGPHRFDLAELEVTETSKSHLTWKIFTIALASIVAIAIAVWFGLRFL